MSPSPADLAAARAGDRAAQARVVAALERSCRWMARRWRLPDTMTPDDAAQDCRIGVLDAIRTYDEARGSFGAWAKQWMRARLRLSVLREAAGAAPRQWKVKAGRFIARETLPLDAPAAGSDVALIDVLAQEDAPASVESQVLVRQLRERLDLLPPRLRVAVEGRLEELELAAIGQRLGGVSDERARQLVLKGLEVLRVELGATDEPAPILSDRDGAAEHGTERRFRRGCRCESCRAAGNAMKKAQRQRQQHQPVVALLN